MKKAFKENFKFIIVLVLIFVLFFVKFPYYIDAPGGIDDVSRKISIEGYESSGSFNLAFVREYRATVPTLIFSAFNKDWKILKLEDVLLDEEDNTSYLLRDKILLQESISNAISVAYTYASKEIKVISNKMIVTYIDANAKTNLNVNDQIISIDNVKINAKSDIESIVNAKNIGDVINIEVYNKNKKYNRYAYIIEEDNSKKIGLIVSNIREYDTQPKVSVKTDKNESGSSGGLIVALSIYNSLIKEDITHGLTIVGTGTIDIEGNVGSIGGVEYKLKSAVKAKADLFLVPVGENYDSALRLKEENNYSIKIVGVSTFKEAIDYLSSIN